MTPQPHTDTQPSTGRSAGQMTVAMSGRKTLAIEMRAIARREGRVKGQRHS